MISRVRIKNYRTFGSLDLALDRGLNILVGDNEAGKSTLLQAIDLCLTGRLLGRPILDALNVHWINAGAVSSYVAALQSGTPSPPPEILIELHLEHDELASLSGTNHSGHEDVPGVRLRIFLDPDLLPEYAQFLALGAFDTVPVELYSYEWHDFSGNPLPPHRKRAFSSTLIDSRLIRLQSGTDYYLRDLMQSTLSLAERAQVALAYRKSRVDVGDTPGLQSLNTRIASASADITSKGVSLSLDESMSASWEASLVPHLDDVPISQAGQGEQASLKILLAILRQNSNSGVLLLEEPENHLSHARLSGLLQRVGELAKGQQVVVATHSSFVLNKLDVGNLKLLNRDNCTTLAALDEDTRAYFRKLAGYDTLRLVCCRACILVEGPSDELMVQRYYRQKYLRQPLDDGIEVMSVQALAFRRFLSIAAALGRRTAVVTDNDGCAESDVRTRYLSELDRYSFLRVFPGYANGGPSLEDQIVFASGRASLNSALGKSYQDDASLIKHMKNNKTDVALALHDAPEHLGVPKYIADAIEFSRSV